MSASVSQGNNELRFRFQVALGDYLCAVGLARNGAYCIAGVGDGSVVGIELQAGRELFRQSAHAGGVLGVSLSPDSSQFVTCGQDPNAKLWNASGTLLRELAGGSSRSWVEHVAWAPSGRRLATAAGRRVRVWSEAGELQREMEPLASTVSALAWRADGTAVAAACYGGIHIWPFVPGAAERHLKWKGSLISLAWSPNGKTIACGSQDNSVHFWRLASGQDSQMGGYPFKPKALAWDSESKLLATAGSQDVTLWDFTGKGPEGTHPLQLRSHQGVCTCIAFSPTQSLLVSGSQDNLGDCVGPSPQGRPAPLRLSRG